MTDSAKRALLAFGCVVVWLGATRRVAAVPHSSEPLHITAKVLGEGPSIAVEPMVRNPFRTDGRLVLEPANEVSFDVTSAPRPRLQLLAIVGGPPWKALVGGVPGRSGGTVVAEGWRVGQLYVRRVRADSVWLEGYDTLWTLALAARP